MDPHPRGPSLAHALSLEKKRNPVVSHFFPRPVKEERPRGAREKEKKEKMGWVLGKERAPIRPPCTPHPPQPC